MPVVLPRSPLGEGHRGGLKSRRDSPRSPSRWSGPSYFSVRTPVPRPCYVCGSNGMHASPWVCDGRRTRPPEAPTASFPPPPLRLPGGANQFPGGTFTRGGPAPFHGAREIQIYQQLNPVRVLIGSDRNFGRHPNTHSVCAVATLSSERNVTCHFIQL
jgi:hypothetical protein